MWKSVLLPLLAAMAPTASARAADEINVWKGATRAGPRRSWLRCRRLLHRGQADLRLGCPCTGASRRNVRFATQANLGTFKANLSKYERLCRLLRLRHGTRQEVRWRDPRFWKIGDGRLYLNLNGDIQAESSKDIAGNIAKADSNWQRIRTVAADRL
jgi:hypothetical protein